MAENIIQDVKIYSEYGSEYIPEYGSEEAAGFDFKSPHPIRWTKEENGWVTVINTGIHVELQPGTMLGLYPRSGLGFKLFISLANTVGIIDSDYRGEIKIKLVAPKEMELLDLPRLTGSKIVQGIIQPIITANFIEDELDNFSNTRRGSGGFGSTGLLKNKETKDIFYYNNMEIPYSSDIDMISQTENKLTFKKNGKLHNLFGPAIILKDGNKEWYLNGELHREDGPAIEYSNGDKEWWLNGEQHREDGPVIEHTNGTKFWYIHNQLHREDGPAIEFANGDKEWFLNGKRHREDGPAIEYADGSKVWYINGKYHREDGPAIILKDGNKEWYLNGEKVSEEEVYGRG